MRYFETNMKKVMLPVLIILIFLVLQPGNMITQENNIKESRQLIDRVAAVVGDEIILLSDVRQKIRVLMIAKNMDENISNSQLQSLLREAVQDMVNEQLILIKAAQDSIDIDLKQVDLIEKERMTELKKQLGSDEAFIKALEEAGLTEQQYRYSVRESSYKYVLTETLMQQIARYNTPTTQDMEAWIIANRDSVPEIPEQFRMSHILIYSKVSEKRKEETREKLQNILKRIHEGEDFTELAKEYSKDPGSAPGGGDLGYFTRDAMVSEFSDVAFSLNAGEVSDVFETQFGFHIVKVEDVKDDQIKARHILLLLTPEAGDEERVINKLKEIREDIISGKATFKDMAKIYSEDENSSELGGRMQWLTREQGLPSFIAQGEKLEPGEISEPFKSQYGYHILRLDDYKPAHIINIKDDNQIIRQLVADKKNMEELDRILNKLKAETYIDIRL